jgi:Spy/CpxP family protein refolding chaperone
MVAVVACLGAMASFAPRASADENASGFDPEEIAALADRLNLSKQQQLAIRKIHDDTRKAEVKLHAEIEVHSIDLRRELERDDPREKTVATLIEKIARLEGEVRKTRIMASLNVRKLLSAAQRKKMQGFRGERRHRHIILERDAMEQARAEIEREADRLESELRELSESSQEIDERARAELRAHKRELEHAAQELREQARELSTRKRELRRVREVKRVRERERERTRERAEQGRATLKVNSPKPAKVFLDGKRIGMTPLVVEVEAGNHKLMLEWKDSKRTRQIHVKGDKDLMLEITPPK